jgi:16S rRNA (guanine527-N7)-methyltransferase
MNKIENYITLLKEYNEHTNVYSKKAYDKLGFHTQDCEHLSSLLPENTQTIIDLGSGSGLPSVILAIKNPNITVTAVESKSRKTNFLFHVKQELNLNNLTIINDNIHEWIHKSSPKADVITAKAFAPHEKALKIAKKLAKPNSSLIIPISEDQAITLKNEKRSDIIKHPDLNTFYIITKLN